MTKRPPSLDKWTPEQIAVGRRWVEIWRLAGEDLERIRRRELRGMDAYRAIQMLCGDYDYSVAPRAPKPYSGLMEQQRLFMKAAGRE